MVRIRRLCVVDMNGAREVVSGKSLPDVRDGDWDSKRAQLSRCR